MKPKMKQLTNPTDGYNRDEKQIIQLLGEHTITELYTKLPTSRMKAIAALHFESGYKQEVLATIFNCTQERISQEVSIIKKLLLNRPDRSKLGAPVKPRKLRTEQKPTMADFIKLAIILHAE